MLMLGARQWTTLEPRWWNRFRRIDEAEGTTNPSAWEASKTYWWPKYAMIRSSPFWALQHEYTFMKAIWQADTQRNRKTGKLVSLWSSACQNRPSLLCRYIVEWDACLRPPIWWCSRNWCVWYAWNPWNRWQLISHLCLASDHRILVHVEHRQILGLDYGAVIANAKLLEDHRDDLWW